MKKNNAHKGVWNSHRAIKDCFFANVALAIGNGELLEAAPERMTGRHFAPLTTELTTDVGERVGRVGGKNHGPLLDDKERVGGERPFGGQSELIFGLFSIVSLGIGRSETLKGRLLLGGEAGPLLRHGACDFCHRHFATNALSNRCKCVLCVE